MAYAFDVNNRWDKLLNNYGGGKALFDLKELALANSWTMVRCCDGSTVSATDIITTVVEMDNTWSWFVIQGPNGREWLFSHSSQTNNNYFHVAYSPSAGFTGGSTSADPTATDQYDLAGTNSSPVQLFSDSSDSYYHVMVDSASDSFYLAQVSQSNLYCTTWIMGDDLSEFVTGDSDPYVFETYYHHNTDHWSTTHFYNVSATSAMYAPRALMSVAALPSTKSMEHVGGMILYGGYRTAIPAGIYGVRTNPESGKEVTLPIVYGRAASASGETGYKGISGFLKGYGGRAVAGTPISVNSTNDYAVFGSSQTAIPWDGGGVVI